MTSTELEFCKAVKNLAKEHAKKIKAMEIACTHKVKNSVVSIAIVNYDEAVRICKCIVGEGIKLELFNREDDFRDCKTMFLHLVIFGIQSA